MAAPSISYWQRTVPDFPLSTDLPSAVDTAVIGGGLLGASTCYWLAKAGVRVALLERTAIAAGATGRNGGEEIDCEYREPGTLRLAITEAQREHYRQEITLLKADGFAAEWLERAQVQDLLPIPLGPEILGARFRPEQGLVHSARLVQGLVGAALRHGAQAYQAEVSTVNREGGQLRLHTSQGLLSAQTVVVAVNAWTSRLLPELAPIIVPVLEQMLAYAPLAPVFPMGIGVDLVDGEYLQQALSGHILIGGCGVVAPNAGFGVWESLPTDSVQQAIEQVLPRIFPSLAPQLHVAQRWAGLLGYTTDSHPIVDAAPNLPGVFFVGGFSGHGMPFGMRLGQLLATTITSGTLSPALAPFRLDRPSLKRWELP